MEPDDNPENGSNKRKLPPSESDANDSKKILLESSVTSTTLSTEVSTTTLAEPDFAVPSSSRDISKHSDTDIQKDVPTSSISLASECVSKVESPSSSVTEDVTKEASCSSSKDISQIEANESEVEESSSEILSSNSGGCSVEVHKGIDRNDEHNLENQVVSSSDQVIDVNEEENVSISSVVVSCEESSSQAEDTVDHPCKTEEPRKEMTSKSTDQAEDKLNISSTTEGGEYEEELYIDNIEIATQPKVPSDEGDSETACQSSVQVREQVGNISEEQVKSPLIQVASSNCSLIPEGKENISFEGRLDISNSSGAMEIEEEKDNKPQDEKVDSSFILAPETEKDPSQVLETEKVDSSIECTLQVEKEKPSFILEVKKVDSTLSHPSTKNIDSPVLPLSESDKGDSSEVSLPLTEEVDSSIVPIPQPEKIDSSFIPILQTEKIESSFVPIPNSEKIDSSVVSVLQTDKIDSSFIPIPQTEKIESSFVPIPNTEKIDSSDVSIPQTDKIDSSFISIPQTEKIDSSFAPIPPTEKIDSSDVSIPQTEKIDSSDVVIPQTEKIDSSFAPTPPTEKIDSSDVSIPQTDKIDSTFVSIPQTEKIDSSFAPIPPTEKIDSSFDPLPEDEKDDSSFVPILQSDSPSIPLITEPEIEQDKKSEASAAEIDSTNHTPIEGSLVDTPCDSGETSPSTSTPADSCQVSAAPSPLLKEDPTSLYDESSMDTKDLPEEIEEDRELENIRPVRFGRRRKKRFIARYKRGRGKSTPVLVDEETRMSTGTPDLGLDEDSQSSIGTTSKTPRRYRSEVVVPGSTEKFTAEKVFEYMWPLEGLGEHYFLQEHISQYLGIISFKRRYPDLRRRPIESQEKEYLKDLGLVTEIDCDLGLTAVRSEDMLDIMFSDFPSRYEELQRVLRERKEKQLKEKGKVDYQVVSLDKSKMQEYSRKAAISASKWNSAFNRERSEERRYCFDLQTFTLHMPATRRSVLPPATTKMGSYPVSVLPGQFTDYCKRYTSNELKGMPLQTVLAGPFTAEELAAEMQEESDEEGSVVASVGTCSEIKEEPDLVPVVDPMSAEKQPRCKVCNGGRARNKDGKPEPLIICGTCRTASHPTCIDLTLAMIDKIESYCWQCMDCKTCAQCNDPDDEERMIFCDMCDRGYHIYCVGLRRVPNGRWHCKECAICFTCGSRNPSGNEHIKNAEWQHEFKKDKDNKIMRYACTLCMPCDKYWKRRQFCSVCLKVYRSIPEDGMVRCLGCPKYVHKDGCSILHENERFCNYCYKSRNKTALNHSRIIAAAKKKMATGSPLWK